jgi:hypothetical protein
VGPRYFAYGSNLTWARLRERVPSSTPLGVARLEQHRLTWDKPGADGSGKANITPAADSVVWGVVYRLEPDEWPRLDACEPGYARTTIEVRLARECVPCTTYRAPGRIDTQLPFDWYHELVIGGARAHGLPESYVRALETIATQSKARP